ncbi:MAG TPA: nitroreductase family protein [Candidatus Avacidaminococcus intestinavium]|uniref:Nitroreductase family protein n=1 Tax=Candidatus Avacidaminococcus intestinavium TaxID=2840684 RepID=A0A9D1MN60_9FIRM|nr:nitroreductase family protein [Candidatus Avacidaminococcus intestinavium]
MKLKTAIYTRRSVRVYTDEKVSTELLKQLIDAAIQAPSAMNKQPWAFGVIQDKALLQRLSDEAKEHLLALIPEKPYLETYKPIFTNPDFNIFYNATTLLTVLAKPEGPNPSCDATIAAQNIMLTAHSLGLGSCWIGFAQIILNTPAIKKELAIPADYLVVAPLIIGYPAKELGPIKKHEPEMLFWQ